jgi:hypothetical protein
MSENIEQTQDEERTLQAIATDRKAMGAAAKRAEEIRAHRAEHRVNIDGVELKLETRGISHGYVGRWVNDDGHIEQLQRRGYEFVDENEVKAKSDGTGTRISQIVGSKEGGERLQAYLMQIPKEIYDEDQKIKQREVDKVDEAIMSGNAAGDDQSGTYMRDQSMKVETA